MINMELLNRVNQAIRTLEDVKKELDHDARLIYKRYFD